MKKLLTLSISMLAIIVGMSSCKKENTLGKALDSRLVTFKLYTDQDFSTDESNITFSIFIKDGGTHLFDSTYAVMKVKDIPKMANAIIVEKKIQANNNRLVVGFNYNIENVGTSWYVDTLSATQKSKVVEFNFR
jgi:hypothetical protein